MIFWRIHKLKEQLSSGQFSARQVLPYLIAAMLWAGVTLVFADWSRPWDRDEFEAGVDSLTTLIDTAIGALGVYWCYRVNGGSSGVQFAERLCALGVVLFMRFLAWTVLALIGWVFAVVFFNTSVRPSFETFDLASVPLAALFWFRLRHHVSAVRSRQA